MTRLPPWLLAAALLAPASSRSLADEPYPLTVPVGGEVNICKTGTIVCPAGAAMCAEPKIAVPERGAEGMVFRGVSAGATLCSAGATDGRGARRVYRVTVKAAPAR